jgi:hypothetical protein
LHRVILAECAARGWIALHGAPNKRTSRTLGEHDFVILARRGHVLLVECKTPEGKMSAKQARLHAEARRLGHTVHIVRSVSDWERIVE